MVILGFPRETNLWGRRKWNHWSHEGALKTQRGGKERGGWSPATVIFIHIINSFEIMLNDLGRIISSCMWEKGKDQTAYCGIFLIGILNWTLNRFRVKPTSLWQMAPITSLGWKSQSSLPAASLSRPLITLNKPRCTCLCNLLTFLTFILLSPAASLSISLKKKEKKKRKKPGLFGDKDIHQNSSTFSGLTTRL